MLRQPLVRLALAFLLTLVTADVAVGRIGDRWAPPSVDWPSTSQQKAADLAALDTGDLEEVVVIGSSAVNDAIDPEVVEAGLGCSLGVRNEGLSQASPIGVEEYLKVAVLPAGQPEVVVFGLTPRDLSSATSGEIYVDSVDPDAGVLLRIEDWAKDHSGLIRHRVFLRTPRLWPFIKSAAADLEVQGDGQNNATVFGDHFVAVDEQERALVRAMTDLQARGIRPVLVSLGVTRTELERWGDPDRTRRDFDRYLASLAAANGVGHLSIVDIDDDDLFVDSIHANLDGREVMSQAIGERLGPQLCQG